METVWFLVLAVMVTLYVVLDGYDLGTGALHLLVARDEEEREEVTESIGPVWNGNEVWLLAAGGTLFMAFPAAYAAAFSGLYFGMILVLWLLIGRGLALELRHQLESPLWRSACDVVFSLSSLALALVFGVALGNVVRGVPLNADGYFFLGLFGILNWYALLVGVFGLLTLAAHGATFLTFKARGRVRERAARLGRALLPAVAVLFVVLALPTYAVREEMLTTFLDQPWKLVFPLLATGSLIALWVLQRRALWGRAFLSSSLFIVGMLTTMAAALYPNVLPAREGQPHGLTVENAAAGDYALGVAIVWWGFGAILAAGYMVYAFRLFHGRTGEGMHVAPIPAPGGTGGRREHAGG
jgi:cytochrome d ubiquinol oxidase subunit II